MPFVRPTDFLYSYNLNNEAACNLLNAVKHDIAESRSFFEKLIDFFTPSNKCIEKYTKKFNDEILSLIKNGFDSLKLETNDAATGAFIYSVSREERKLMFTSSSPCLTLDELSHALINTAGVGANDAFRQGIPNSEGTSGTVYVNGGSYGAALTPIDEYGNYYADHQNGVLFVNSKTKEVGGAFDALCHLVHHGGLKPFVVNITKDLNGRLILAPGKKQSASCDGGLVEFEHDYSGDNLHHNFYCNIKNLGGVVRFLENTEDIPGVFQDLVVDDITEETIGIFKEFASDETSVLEGGPGSSSIQVRRFNQINDKMISILFLDIPKQRSTQHIFSAIVLNRLELKKHGEIRGYQYTRNKLIHIIAGEQIFDSQKNGKTDTEQSILLADAIMKKDVIIYYNKNNNTLTFSGYTFDLSHRSGSNGEGRGRHITESEKSPGTIDKKKLINSLFFSPRHQYALEFMSPETINTIFGNVQDWGRTA